MPFVKRLKCHLTMAFDSSLVVLISDTYGPEVETFFLEDVKPSEHRVLNYHFHKLNH